MSSPVRSVAVRLSMDPASYIAGAARAEASTLSLDRAVSKVGPSSATSMERAAKSADKTGSSFLSLNSITGRLGIGVGALAGLTGAAVVKMAGDYQQSVTKLATTAGESTKNLHMVSQGMLDMAGQVGVSAQELAKGMYTVESSGMHGADALLVLKAAAQGARQEQADLSHVTDAVTTSLHDYHLPASQAATVTSQLIAAVSRGKTTFDELTGAMHSVEPIAASAGMSIAQTAGALAAMTASGMHADQAAQNLASSIRSFEKPTGTMRDELYQLGLDANDLSAHLGERGIAGTLQMVSDAIVKKMGPAGQVALDSLNKNKAAAQDLVIMMKSMTPEVAKLSSGLLDGSVSVTEYSKAAKGLGGQQAAMAIQFLSLYKSSAGFSQILKSGGPAVQTYLGALGKGVGTAEGLSVALQLTGENAKGTNDAIHAVATAAGDAKGNIQGWDEVQGNFNQQLAQTEAHAKSLAIEAGQHLLPVLTAGLTWINEHGDAALHSLGQSFTDVGSAMHPIVSLGGGVLDVFKALPGPVQETVLALGALKIAGSLGWLDGLSSGAGKVGGAFRSMSAEITTAFAAAKANQVRLVTESAALWGQSEAEMARMKAASTGLWATAAKDVETASVSMKASTGNMAGLGAAAGAAAKGGLGALKSAGAGLMGMFGGPWGLVLTGAALGVSALTASVEHHDEQVKKATQDVLAWNKAITFGGGGATATQAAQHLDDLRQQIAAINTELEKASKETPSFSFGQSGLDVANSQASTITTLTKKLADLHHELDKGASDWKKQLDAMTPVEEAQARVDIATKDLNDALKHNSGDSQAVTNASIRLTQAQSGLASETQRATDAQKSQIQQLQDASNALVADAQAQAQAVHAQAQLNGALTTYRALAKPSADDQATLADAARNFAQSQADAAVAQAKANGVTDTGTVGQVAYLKALQKASTQMGLSTPASISALISSLTAAQGATGQTIGSFQHLGAQSDEEKKKLQDLGHVIATLPDGSVVVTADTNPARAAIQDLLQYARTQAILYRATLPSLVDNRVTSGSGRYGLATGGWVRGRGSGTSDEVPLMGSNGEFMVKAASAGMYGPTAMDAVNQGRAKIIVPALAGGGWVGPPGNGSTAQVPVRIDPSSVSAVNAAMHAKLAAAAAVATSFGGAGQWSGLVLQSLAMLGQPSSLLGSVLRRMNQESGGNPNAINLWDSNARAGIPSQGLMQDTPPTFAAYHDPRTSWNILDPLANLLASERYALARYGSLSAAYDRAGGYKGGTPYVPEDGIYNLHRGERVVTAEVNAAPRTREFFGGRSAGGHRGTVTVPAPQVHVYLDGAQWHGIARVEAEAVVTEFETARSHRGTYNPGGGW